MTFPKNIKMEDFTNIPSSTLHLSLLNRYDGKIDLTFPPFLTHLIFNKHSSFNQPITCFKNSSLTHITFGDRFNHEISNNLPPTLVQLSLGYRYILFCFIHFYSVSFRFIRFYLYLFWFIPVFLKAIHCMHFLILI